MDNKQILEKTISKAVDGGWVFQDIKDLVNFKIKTPINDLGYPWYLFRALNNDGQEVESNIEHVIFNHDFAKAIWGEAHIPPIALKSIVIEKKVGDIPFLPAWQYHLQQMVINEDPIKYLGDNL